MALRMKVKMPPLHRGQWRVRNSPARFKVLACGRRWGKTLLGACMCMETALAGGVAWWVAPDFPRAKIAWRMMIRLSKQIPGCTAHKGEAMIETMSGGWIQLKSAVNPDSLRGEGLDRVVIDECADVAQEAWFESLRPALTDRMGDALFIGTPKGRNWFYDLWRQGKKLEGWESFSMPTSDNPYIPRAELAFAKSELPKRTWDQEYMAKFVTFEGRVYDSFDPDGPMVFDTLDKSLYHTFWGAIDFGFRNPTAIVVSGEDSDSRLDIIDEVYERRLTNPEVIDIVKGKTKEHGVRMWWGDASNPAMIQELEDAGLPVEACPRSSGGQESVVQWEVRLVDGLLQENPPALRFYGPGCPEAILEHDGYRYPKKAHADSQENEMPMKINDHSCNAVQYLVHGLRDWYGLGGEPIGGGTRESFNMPT